MKKLKKLGLVVMSGVLVVGTLANLQSYATVPGNNTLVSVNNSGDGQGGNASSPHTLSGSTAARNIDISDDGRYVAFTSTASNLVSNDTNGKPDVFVRDLVNNLTVRVNVSTSGVQANGGLSYADQSHVAISSTGRYVVFPSLATNLIDGQTTSIAQLYMRDTLTGTTTVVTQRSEGTLGKGMFYSLGGVSNDGRFVSWAGNLDTNLVSTETNTQSYYVYLTDLKTHTTTVLNHTPSTGQYFVSGLSMNCDGSFIAFVTKLQLDPGDTDSSEDVYLADMRNGFALTGVTTSSNTGAFAGLPSLSCNGRYITFRSADNTFSSLLNSSNSTDHQFLYDRINATFSLVSASSSGIAGNGNSSGSAAVDDKGDVVFGSGSTNLISGATTAYGQQFLKHADSGVVEVVSKPSGSAYSNGVGGNPSISADGKTVVYWAGDAATTLLSSDTNGKADVIASSTGL